MNTGPTEGGLAEYAEAREGDSTLNERRPGDVDSGEAKPTADPSWFATVPRAVREAMRSREKKPMPPGYEERLQEYFQNQD